MPEAPHDPAGIAPFAEVRETHVAVVFLVGDRAYKLKKPVDLGFLDFSTRERRRDACRRELELNRQFAPDVYLGLIDIPDVDGAPCDHLLVMRRMPDDRRLSTMVAAGEPLTETITALARKVAAFHATARRSAEIDAEGSRDAILGRWEASFAQVREVGLGAIDPQVLDETIALTREYLAGREPLFRSRAAAGRIIDGHGDLLADDIFCLDDGPRVLDCLEFDDHLRRLDGLDDIAFLAMDLERLGAPDLSRLLLDRYAEFAADPAPATLRRHYVAYRAFVRAKVACLRHSQGVASAADEAALHATIALDHLRSGQVQLTLVGGLPGTGKTTLAGMLADELGAVLVSSDRLRKELAGTTPTRHAAAPYGTGIYDTAQTERTYRALLDRAAVLLERGESVVLDASWIDDRHRAAAAATARQTHSRLVQLRCEAPAEIAAARLTGRRSTLSDADPAIAAAMSAVAVPWPEAVTIDTIASPESCLAEALRAVR